MAEEDGEVGNKKKLKVQEWWALKRETEVRSERKSMKEAKNSVREREREMFVYVEDMDNDIVVWGRGKKRGVIVQSRVWDVLCW